MNLAQHSLILALRLYRAILSPILATAFGPTGRCRFTPSCSRYAQEAIQTHGALRGTFLAGARLCRCHPWGGCGEDPVPQNLKFQIPPLKSLFKSRHSHCKVSPHGS